MTFKIDNPFKDSYGNVLEHSYQLNESKLAAVEATRKINLPLLPLPTTLIALRMLEGGGDVNTAPHTAALSMPGPTYPTINTDNISNTSSDV